MTEGLGTRYCSVRAKTQPCPEGRGLLLASSLPFLVRKGRRHYSTQSCLGKCIILIKLYFFKHSHRGRTSCLTHTDLWIFFNIKQSLRKVFFHFFVFVIPLAQGLWQQVGVKGSWSCHWAVTGHRRRAPAWEWLHSHTQEYSPTGQPHHTHNTDADVYPASTTALEGHAQLWVSPICEKSKESKQLK